MFHVSKLRPYHEDRNIHEETYARPPPDIIDDEEQWEIEKIVRHERRGRGRRYLIHWKGYLAEEDLWLSESVLAEDAPELLAEYKQIHGLNQSSREEPRILTILENGLTCPVHLTHPAAMVPKKSTDGAAGYDLYAVEDVSIAPHTRALVKRVFRLNYRKGHMDELLHVVGWHSRTLLMSPLA